MKVPTGMATGCYVYAHDYDVGVIVRLELGVIITGLGLNVKRAEVAACENCGGKSSGGREARPSDSRGRELSRFRGVAAAERSDSDGERRKDNGIAQEYRHVNLHGARRLATPRASRPRPNAGNALAGTPRRRTFSRLAPASDPAVIGA